MLIIPKGESFWHSYPGHYNVHYPSRQVVAQVDLTFDATPLPYICEQGYKAYQVSTKIAHSLGLEYPIIWI